tara:strand:+ start:409 stop:588 length:180 start_codon:yes stop_codon:yes gene_type:complete
MDSENSKIDKIIETLCKGKDEEYKIFIKNMINIMNDSDKWGKLSELNDLNEQIKNKKTQ